MKKLILIFTVFFIAFNFLNAQSYKIIHQFDGTQDGSRPNGTLIASGFVFYGVTTEGGTYDKGTIFSINPDGTGYKTIHSFNGGNSDGSSPAGTLTESGSFFYGLTNKGGSNDFGTIYKINKDGSGFTLLHSFSGGQYDGRWPNESLLLSGNYLYGVTSFGGITDSGTVFKINVDGSGFEVIHSFSSQVDNSYLPQSSLLIFRNQLYSMSYGSSARHIYLDYGTIFRLNTDGSNFEVLHNFDNDTLQTSVGMIFIDSVLYGTTNGGGSHTNNGHRNGGSIYKINPDGNGFKFIYEFRDTDWTFPYCDLTFFSNNIYSMTSHGGSSNSGNLYRFDYTTSSYFSLHSFGDDPSDGRLPYQNGILVYNGNIYGLCQSGGINKQGIIFMYGDTSLDTCSTESFTKPDFRNSAEIAFNSAAKLKDSVIRLVPALNNLAGSIFYKQPITINSGFSTEFSFRFSNGYNDVPDGSPDGADGIAFVVQANNSGYYGKNGGGLGYSGIPNSLAVEFDSYNDDNDLGDPDGSHVAVFSNGKLPNSSNHRTSALLGCSSKIPLLKADSTTYYGKIEYLPIEKRLNIYCDNSGLYKVPVLSVDSIQLSKLLNLIDGSKAYAGFSSATGASYQNTDLISWSFCSKKGNGIQSEAEQPPSSVPNDVIISPNPVSDFLSIKSDKAVNRMEIFSALGESILVEQAFPAVNQSFTKIDVSSLLTGFYFIKFGDKIFKFIKL